ncbi:PLDc N-terminal domain-containing protein [Arcticibacter sp.]|uniref:PLDc N-terminal domain-containing protein n=1 Tax=Arcticibacter sp. TaxID=1872630 RepID=UPI003890DF57
MPPSNVVKAVFYFGYSIQFALAALKIMYPSMNFSMELIVLVLITVLSFMVMALMEIYKSKHVTQVEKIMWTTAFLFFHWLAGIIYFFMGRKRVTRSQRTSESL